MELEDKLNTLIGLNEKLSVFTDLKRDVKENQSFVRESEEGREVLQVTITKTAESLKEDTLTKVQYQNSLLEEIKSLKEHIQRQEELAAETRQAHLAEIDEIGRKNAQNVLRINEDHAVEINHKNKVIEQLNVDIERNRREYHLSLTSLTKEKEEQRSQNEIKINELEMSLRKCQQTIVKLESVVLELNTRLSQKQDVEKQLK